MSGDSQTVVIVGAGPAGLAAVDILRPFGMKLVVIDEQPRAGGQFLRQPPRGFAVARWLTGGLYTKAKAALGAVQDAVDVDWRFGSTALGVMRNSAYRGDTDLRAGHEIWLQGPAGCEIQRADAVLLASGCYERPLGFPGWTLPGVMGAGAIQGFVKSQQFVPGERFVLSGSHPLQLVVADQLLAAGANVAAVVFTQQASRAAAAMRHPLTMLQHGRQLTAVGKILWRLKRAGVPVLFGRTVVAAEGRESVAAATIAPVDAAGNIDRGQVQEIACDRIGVCHGFLASSELARQAGARVRWHGSEGGWIVDHDEWFESSVTRLFVAGELTGVAGADASLEKGRIAGVGILAALGRIDRTEAQALADAARRRLKRRLGFAGALNRLAEPPPRLSDAVMTEQAILCRCESITRGEFHTQLEHSPHVCSADAAKLLTRVGMGMCQGRLCGDNVVRLMARRRGVEESEVGPFQAQMPVKPVIIDSV